VAAVVLSWNGREDTLDCLASLREVRFEPLTVVVVDNGSSDGTAEAVEAAFPEAVVVRSEENLGFSGGNNLGIREALRRGGDYVLLLNNDTLVDPGMVAALVTEAEGREDAGALCPLMYYAHEEGLIWYAGADFDPRRGHNGRLAGYRERDTGRYSEVREITQASGAAMLVPARVIDEVGGLDENLFLHVEDVEWSLRIGRAGYRLYFVPSATLRHKVSVDSGGEQSPSLAYYGTRNTLAVCSRYAPRRGPAAALRQAVTVGAWLAHSRRAEHPLENARAVIAGWRDYRQGRLGRRA